jgi:hypothetical protein
MTVFDSIHSKNIDELVEWLDKNGAYTESPWMKWYDKTYCRKCEPVVSSFVSDCYGDYWSDEHEFTWCELYGNCRYFNNMKKVPDRKQTIRLWLESEG